MAKSTASKKQSMATVPVVTPVTPVVNDSVEPVNLVNTDNTTANNANANREATLAAVKDVLVGGKAKDRTFRCIVIGENGEVLAKGRYSGKKPKQAASKACTRLYEALRKEGSPIPVSIIYGMHECTRSRNKKKYFYIGKRIELPEPEMVPIHLKDPETGKIMRDKDGNKVPKTDPKTGEPVLIPYTHNNDVKKLTNVYSHPEYFTLFNYDLKEEDRIDATMIKVAKKQRAPYKTAKKTLKAVSGKKVKVAKTPKVKTPKAAVAKVPKAKVARTPRVKVAKVLATAPEQPVAVAVVKQVTVVDPVAATEKTTVAVTKTPKVAKAPKTPKEPKSRKTAKSEVIGQTDVVSNPVIVQGRANAVSSVKTTGKSKKVATK